MNARTLGTCAWSLSEGGPAGGKGLTLTSPGTTTPTQAADANPDTGQKCAWRTTKEDDPPPDERSEVGHRTTQTETTSVSESSYVGTARSAAWCRNVGERTATNERRAEPEAGRPVPSGAGGVRAPGRLWSLRRRALPELVREEGAGPGHQVRGDGVAGLVVDLVPVRGYVLDGR